MSRKQRWVVIENTPGYLPDNDEPATFDTFDEAVVYGQELACELEEEGYEVRNAALAGPYAAWYATRPGDIYDLGRVIEVTPMEEEAR